jgi:glycosyltransferase involved in cell wall biosynthesis
VNVGHRVAFLNYDLWAGGSTVFSLTLGSELQRRGIPAHVFSMHRRHPLIEDFGSAGLAVTRPEHEHWILEDRLAFILRAIRAFEPTAIVACLGFETCETLRYIPSSVARIGMIHATHAGSFEWIDDYAQWLDLIVGVSRAVEDEIKTSVRFPEERITSVELGVPIPETSHKLSDSNEPLKVLYLGRLEEGSKRVRLFPRILRRLRELGVPFHWTIAGVGPERGFLEAEMTSVPNQAVSFAGLINYRDVPKLLAEHDVILLTSDSETFSLTLHEAMAAGLVPVASDIPGRVGEIVTPETGKPVPPNEPEAYADAIAWLHGHRAELALMSKASRKMIAENSSASAMTERWLKLLARFTPNPNADWVERLSFRKPVVGKAWWFHPALRPFRRFAAKNRRLPAG